MRAFRSPSGITTTITTTIGGVTIIIITGAGVDSTTTIIITIISIADDSLAARLALPTGGEFSGACSSMTLPPIPAS